MRDVAFGYGVSADDALLQYTTTGWMMWNLMIAGLAWRPRLILYDRSPLHPSLPAFLRLVHDQGVSVLGVSPRFLGEMHWMDIKPLALGLFNALKTIASEGAVLTPALHTWAHNAFVGRVRVFTPCGGTDIFSAFATSALSELVYAGAMPCKALGMK
ncbi:Acetoacetyl-CoA synthetase [Termitomyces sp. T112]|nr:Acetoacetyl-CoA synthetase [Termitomyces sp. T112]